MPILRLVIATKSVAKRSEVNGLPSVVLPEDVPMAELATNSTVKIIVGSINSTVALVYYLVLNDGNQAQFISEPMYDRGMARKIRWKHNYCVEVTSNDYVSIKDSNGLLIGKKVNLEKVVSTVEPVESNLLVMQITVERFFKQG